MRVLGYVTVDEESRVFDQLLYCTGKAKILREGLVIDSYRYFKHRDSLAEFSRLHFPLHI